MYSARAKNWRDDSDRSLGNVELFTIQRAGGGRARARVASSRSPRAAWRATTCTQYTLLARGPELEGTRIDDRFLRVCRCFCSEMRGGR